SFPYRACLPPILSRSSPQANARNLAQPLVSDHGRHATIKGDTARCQWNGASGVHSRFCARCVFVVASSLLAINPRGKQAACHYKTPLQAAIARMHLRFGGFMAASDLVLAFTGASGTPYGVRLLEVLLAAGRTVHLTLSPAGVEVLAHELDRHVRLNHFVLSDLLGDAAEEKPGQVLYYDYRDFRAGI